MDTNNSDVMSLAPHHLPNQHMIMKELQTFLAGATRVGKIRSADVAKSAIFLLKVVPATKDAVLEFLYNLFDEAVNNYILKLELEDTVTTNAVTGDEKVIQEIHNVLSGFIKNSSEAWAPVISTWSLDLLGYLSSKYAERRAVPRTSNLPEVLQLWMTCKPTRTLINLTAECLDTLINTNPDACIDALLETSVQHSPHFDWVVAHIGSCFPTTIITRVLACGLKDFCAHGDVAQDLSVGSNKKVPKIASVVGILGHLAGQHGDDIRHAIVSLFNQSFSSNPTKEQLATIPFLLHLASMSSMLLQVMTVECVRVLTTERLNSLSHQVSQWKTMGIPGTEGLLRLVVHLLLQSGDGCSQVIMHLLDVADPSGKMEKKLSPEVSKAAGLILDTFLMEIQNLVFAGTADIPLLSSLKTQISSLCDCLLTSTGCKQSWMLNVLKFLCSHGGKKTASATVGYLLKNVIGNEQFACLKNLIDHVQFWVPDVLSETITQEIAVLKSTHVSKATMLIKNIVRFLSTSDHARVIEALQPSLETLALQVTASDLEYSDAIVRMLSKSILPEKMSMSVVSKVCSSAVYYFFVSITSETALAHKLERIFVCKELLSNVCQQSAAQNLVLRTLVEGVLDKRNAPYFGSKIFAKPLDTKPKSTYTSLAEENRKHAISITLPQNHSSIFHAGVVGDGLRPPQRPNIRLLKHEELLNRQLLIEVLQSCCQPSWRFPSDKPVEKSHHPPLAPGMTIVALLMVELISPDVMFNGLPWPDEEFMKVTIERDLRISRTFEDHPILWDLLHLVAKHHPSLCYCSVLLRAMMGVLLSHWGSCQDKTTTNSPKQLAMTQQLLDIMALGQLLPSPLSYVGEILPQLTPFEAYCLLTDIWHYMKENVPSPALFTAKDPKSNLLWRDFSGKNGEPACDPKFTNRLKYILQSNIEKFGNVFAKFFPH